MSKTNNPCFNCENRKVGCHSNCEKYIEYKADWNEKAKLKRLNKNSTIHGSQFTGAGHRPRKPRKR